MGVRFYPGVDLSHRPTPHPPAGISYPSACFKMLAATGSNGWLCVWDLEHFERHTARNLLCRMDLLRPELGDAVSCSTDLLPVMVPLVMLVRGPRNPQAAGGAKPSAA